MRSKKATGRRRMRDDARPELIKQAPRGEPLLLVLEQDKSLTRSISFHRDFSPHRHIINVYEAAYRALSLILEIPLNEADADWEDIRRGRPEIVANRLRALWNKQRGALAPGNSGIRTQ